uniref:Uncharacterized protein n=1 Tax=Onchocerca volvulus TaxID=6282 RepID=A0A8R1U136_ONCVO
MEKKFAYACIQQQTPIFQHHHDEVYRHIHNDRKTDTYQSHFDELVPGGETFVLLIGSIRRRPTLLQQLCWFKKVCSYSNNSALKEQRETKNQC